jgi:hypothetical protein
MTTSDVLEGSSTRCRCSVSSQTLHKSQRSQRVGEVDVLGPSVSEWHRE